MLEREIIFPPALIGRIVQFLFQMNIPVLVISELILSPLVSHFE